MGLITLLKGLWVSSLPTAEILNTQLKNKQDNLRYLEDRVNNPAVYQQGFGRWPKVERSSDQLEIKSIKLEIETLELKLEVLASEGDK